jgi:hypothetical protein
MVGIAAAIGVVAAGRDLALVVEQPIEHMRASLAVESGAGGGAAGVTAPSKPGGAGATSTMIKPFLSECPAAARCGPPVRVLALGLVLGSGGRKGLSAGSAGVFCDGARKRRAAARCCGVPCRLIISAAGSVRSSALAGRGPRQGHDHGRDLMGRSPRPCVARSRARSRPVHQRCSHVALPAQGPGPRR